MKRLWSWLLVICILISGLAVLGPPVSAAEGEQTKRSIAIVYDNSYSMYENKNKAWCQALYAMEVFASMMNEGDELRVYPMHDIYVKGKDAPYTSSNPLIIESPQDAKIIESISTKLAQGTPITPVENAYDNYLKEAEGEKWLIVLTDGALEDASGKRIEPTKLVEKFQNYAKGVNIIFLSIGSDAQELDLGKKKQHDHYVESKSAKKSSDVPKELTRMCNLIFNRNDYEAVAGKISSDTISFDVSLKSLFIFVQGKDIADVSLSSGSGEKKEEYTVSYNTNKECGRDTNGEVDKNLQGVIAKYDNVAIGDHTLDYKGDRNDIGVYYEPDVELVVQLVDENGNVVNVDENTVLTPGKYKISYGFIDVNDKEGKFTESKFLGDTEYDLTYNVNGETKTASSKQKKDETDYFEVEAETTLELEKIHVKYLNGRELDKNGSDFNWPSGGIHIELQAAGSFSMDVEGIPETYKLSDKGEIAPFVATFKHDGESMSAEEVATIEFDVTSEHPNISFKWEPDGDHINIWPQFPDNYDEITQMDVAGKATATYTEQGHEPASDEYSINFNVELPAKELTIEIAGGPETGSYKLSQLEDDDQPFVATFLYGGEKLKAEEVAEIKDFTVQGSTVNFETKQDGDHYNIYPRYPDSDHPENTNCDEAVSAAVTASYTAPGHGEAKAEGTISFSIENDITGLSAKLDKSKERFTLAELDGYTIDLDLLMGGEPLSEAEMENLEFSELTITDKKGNSIPYTIEKDTGSSKVGITLSKEGVKTGQYTIKVEAKTKNEVGADTKSSDHYKFKVKLLPVWVIMTAIFAALALLSLLLWFILSRKVLPKRIIIDNTRYTVDGEANPGAANVQFNGSRKKVGTVQITPPRAVMYPGVRGNYTLHVAASDTRFKVLKKKITGKGNLTMMCTNIVSHANVNRVMISGTIYNWDDDHNLKMPPGEESIPPFRIANEDTAIMNATAMSGSTEVSLNMNCTLLLK